MKDHMKSIVTKQFEMLRQTTVRLEAKKGKKTIFGTGFFYSIDFGSDYIPFLITNKHVLQHVNQLKVSLSVHLEADPKAFTARSYQFPVFPAMIIEHPDQEVDLCALTIVPLVDELTKEGIQIKSYFFTKGVIPNETDLEELDAMEEVIMVGYPVGLWDEAHNLPLFRRGITASSAALDFNNKKIFLVDMTCLEGSSGSPVVYLNKSYIKDMGNDIRGHATYLLGILSASPTYTKKVISNDKKLEAKVNIPINIGYVIKAEEILELEKIILAKLNQNNT